MSSESGQRLPMEELKRRNAPPSITPQSCPSKEEWENLLLMIRALHRLTAEQSNTLENLNQHTAAHTALLRKTENGEVLTSFRDTCYQHQDDHIINQREMLIGGKVFHVTSVFQVDATATPTDKLLSLIDTDLKKETHNA